MDTKNIKDTAESLKLKAEARSERIEGKIREKLGNFADDPESVEHGQEKQEKAAALEQEAKQKRNDAS
jgi:uncharacterized protein YjbJ (UPF0337 family)